MKKVIHTILAISIAVGTISAQNKDKEEFAKKGDNLINIYYGVSLLNSVYKAAASADALGVKFSSVGPVGVVYEHIVTDGIGIGAEFGYSQSTLSYDMQQTVYTGGGTSQTSNYSYKWQFTTIRAMFRANFHFVKDEKLDIYALISAGYRKSSYSISSNDPAGTQSLSFGGIIPFGIKPGFGFRYFFLKNVGAHMELALGTPIIGGGLSLKFR